jgi:hypothetical protein
VLHPLADSGNAGAQYLVGIILAKGGAILPDDVLDNANININTSTDNGASSGLAGSEDDRQAAMAALAHAYFKRAAQQRHIGAAFELAFQFERGIGTNTDLKRARLLYKVAGPTEPSECPVQSGYPAGYRKWWQSRLQAGLYVGAGSAQQRAEDITHRVDAAACQPTGTENPHKDPLS